MFYFFIVEKPPGNSEVFVEYGALIILIFAIEMLPVV